MITLTISSSLFALLQAIIMN